jgi:hypothetical protein
MIIIIEIVQHIMAAVFAFAAAVVGTVSAAPVASVAVDVEQIHIAQGGPAGEWPTPCGFTDMLMSRDTMVCMMPCTPRQMTPCMIMSSCSPVHAAA